MTGGGDAPGLNAVIRAVVKSAANSNYETIGIEDGFDGLIDLVTAVRTLMEQGKIEGVRA